MEALTCAPEYTSFDTGSAIYLAPEVLRRSYDQKADIWGAGIIAYQLLTGRLPFAGEEGQEVSDRFMAKQLCSNRVQGPAPSQRECLIAAFYSQSRMLQY